MYRKPHAIYCDRGQHFFNSELREFLKEEGVAIDYSLSAASKSTGMVESSNRVLAGWILRELDKGASKLPGVLLKVIDKHECCCDACNPDFRKALTTFANERPLSRVR